MIEKSIISISQATGKSVLQAFSDFLDYTIWYFGIGENKAIKGWPYKEEHNKMFFEALNSLIKDDYKPRIDARGWSDPLGDAFMALQSRMDASFRGQFFTPEDLCTMMAMTSLNGEMPEGNLTKFGRRPIGSDPAAGSARNILAMHARAMYDLKWPRKIYFVAEDVDPTCAKMSAINMAVHGCFGEVVCHDTLAEPKSMKFGYIINETMNPFPCPIPSIRRTCDPSDFYLFGYAKPQDD